ncbi:hypothetical protein M513_05258 [Trichuris suis]|uniref:Uncharacterized protein n=1 Tax=Trichuris suis TaxID=68888 RepID=A0A085M9U5_9BILA|nr:hypothetical protein M513_05258 [Trichuris suis]
MVRNVIAVQAVTSCHPKKGGGSYSATALSSKCNFEIGLVMVPLAVRKRAERTISSDPATRTTSPTIGECLTPHHLFLTDNVVVYSFCQRFQK